MAKKSKKEKAPSDAATSRAEQLRAAVEGAFGATAHGAGPVQKRAQELADELVGAATRLREALVSGDDLAGTATRLRETLGSAEAAAAAAKVRDAVEGLRPPSTEQVEALRTQVEKLEARAAKPAAAKTIPARSTAARKAAPAARSRSTAARKPPAGGGQAA
jgi:ABC-type transporter Mla subunit MlaD